MNPWQFLFGFEGRFNRARMWSSYLILMAAEVPIIVVGTALGTERMGAILRGPPWNPLNAVAVAFFCIMAAAIVWSLLAAVVKRLHDRDKSTWWLLFFIGAPVAIFNVLQMVDVAPGDGEMSPIRMLAAAAFLGINFWYFAELFFLKGTEGPNRFGPDPLHSL